MFSYLVVRFCCREMDKKLLFEISWMTKVRNCKPKDKDFTVPNEATKIS